MGKKHYFRSGEKKKKKPKQSTYLDPMYDEINAAFEGGNVPIHMPESLKGGQPTPTFWGGHGQSYGGSVSNVACNHDGDKVIFEQDGKALYAASGHGLNEFSGKWDLIIDLNKNVRVSPFVMKGTSSKYEGLAKLSGPSKVKSDLLILDWPDMSPPPVELDFWVSLWDMLPAKTVAACQGGHGRTGSCIAALMIVAGESYYDALDDVRKKHCEKAVETLRQEEYLYNLYLDRLEAEHNSGIDVTAAYNYALEHKPTGSKAVKHWTKAAEAEPAKKKENGHSIYPGLSGSDITAEFLSMGIESKVVAGMTYIKECVNPQCNNVNCYDKDHMGWIEISKWDGI